MSKKIVSILLLLLMCRLFAVASEPNVTGIWLVGEKDYHIELYKNASGAIEGKVVWMKVANDSHGKPRTDIDNPDEKLRSRPIMGLKTVTDFKWNEADGAFVNGKVYKKGKIYCGMMKLNSDGTLFLRGYICSVSFLGKSDTWTRIK